ncbi:hypothetical protein CKAH01_06921 [Colletotrichum kahawae]|uniref:MARVEL domain-containing protein n=1 Tax=Colletotrichum kahawae TaxID=34407 RepID=A0AAE0D222_COLKA|nr:hypothetical protein CKAH01_06921 [Colletotrichum kahawae]
MKNSDKYASRRTPDSEHIPLFPKGYMVFRFLQLALTIALLVICARTLIWGLRDHGRPIGSIRISLLVFSSIVTIVTVWHLVSYYRMSKFYNYWVVLVFDIIFLPCMVPISILALWVAIKSSEATRAGENLIASRLTVLVVMGFLLVFSFIISLILHIVGIHRHRKDRLHSRPGVSPVMANDHVDSESQNRLPYVNHPQRQNANQQQQTGDQQQQTADQQQQAAIPPMPDAH